MKKIYWELNKYGLTGYLILNILFFIISIFMIVVVKDMENYEFTATTGLIAIVASVIFGAIGAAMAGTYIYIIIKPFVQKHFEQVIQIGEDVTKYTVIHFAIIAMLTIIPPLLAMPVLSLFTDASAIFSENLTNDVMQNINSIISSLATVGWIMIIPLCIYNEKILPNASSKQKAWIVTIIVLFVWFCLSILTGVPDLVRGFQDGFNYGTSMVETKDMSLVITKNEINTPTIGAFIFTWSLVTDIVGVLLFAISYYGFSKNYTVRR